MPIEQRLPAENSHYQLSGEAVIAGRKLREVGGVEQFGGIRFFAFDPQENSESRGASGRNGHGSLLSQMAAGLGPVAVDEFLRGHAALALELNFDQFQRRLGPFVFVLSLSLPQPTNRRVPSTASSPGVNVTACCTG